MEAFTSFDFRELPPRESYALLTTFIQPRPIAFVSTMSAAGILNLAPFSFFMAGGSNPPSICYSPTLNSSGREKDSLTNVRETREFVVNTVHREMAEGMNMTSASFSPDISEWDGTEFTPLPSVIVTPPRVAQSFAQMECKLFDIVHHGEGPTAARYIIGEVVCFHARSDLIHDGRLNPSEIPAIGRMGGPGYVDTAALQYFELERPR